MAQIRELTRYEYTQIRRMLNSALNVNTYDRESGHHAIDRLIACGDSDAIDEVREWLAEFASHNLRSEPLSWADYQPQLNERDAELNRSAQLAVELLLRLEPHIQTLDPTSWASRQAEWKRLDEADREADSKSLRPTTPESNEDTSGSSHYAPSKKKEPPYGALAALCIAVCVFAGVYIAVQERESEQRDTSGPELIGVMLFENEIMLQISDSSTPASGFVRFPDRTTRHFSHSYAKWYSVAILQNDCNGEIDVSLEDSLGNKRSYSVRAGSG